MRLAFSLVSICLISIFFFTCKKENASNCPGSICDIQKIVRSYNYPILPGTSQWAAFTSQQQKLNACQIPQDSLNIMTTDIVMQSSLNFPLLGDLLLNVGVNVPAITSYYMTNFTGLIELSKRKDAGLTMLTRYKLMDINCFNCLNTDIQKGNFITNFSAYEMIISQDSIIEKFDLQQKKDLTKEAINKYNVKKSAYDYYGDYGLATALYVAAKLMQSVNYQPFMQVYNQDINLQIFVQKLLWPLDMNLKSNMFNLLQSTAVQFFN